MLLTNEILNEGKSCNGGWSLSQFRLFGFDTFPKKDWKDIVCSQEWPKETIDQFLYLKDKHLKRYKRKLLILKSVNIPKDMDIQDELAWILSRVLSWQNPDGTIEDKYLPPWMTVRARDILRKYIGMNTLKTESV